MHHNIILFFCFRISRNSHSKLESWYYIEYICMHQKSKRRSCITCIPNLEAILILFLVHTQRIWSTSWLCVNSFQAA